MRCTFATTINFPVYYPESPPTYISYFYMSPQAELLPLVKSANTIKEDFTKTNKQESLWKKELASAISSVPELLKKAHLENYANKIDNQTKFKCLVTNTYLRKIKNGDINDPLLKQILPLKLETHDDIQKHGKVDPVGDLNAEVTQGLLHKYHGRALVISTGACAIHCRYCFRRAYPYADSAYTNKELNNVLDYLNQHHEIDEIILSGGDPLILSNEKLKKLIEEFEKIEHIKTLRIHSRIPVVLPNRITKNLIHILKTTRLYVVMVIHANHANELQQEECEKLHLLHEAGIMLFNQSVLLKGVNDNATALSTLSKRLLQCKTTPYYIHLLDPVTGAMHFEVSKKTAQSLLQKISTQLPGYLVPKLAQEIAGSPSKTTFFNI